MTPTLGLTRRASADFFLAAILAPVTAELALVSRLYDGVGCASSTRFVSGQQLTHAAHARTHAPDGHVYGAFNLSYGLGAACECLLLVPVLRSDATALLTQSLRTVGPVVGGQVRLLLARKRHVF